MKMNLNQVAKEICLREGKKIQVNIAQVKEVLKITLQILKEQENMAKNPSDFSLLKKNLT